MSDVFDLSVDLNLDEGAVCLGFDDLSRLVLSSDVVLRSGVSSACDVLRVSGYDWDSVVSRVFLAFGELDDLCCGDVLVSGHVLARSSCRELLSYNFSDCGVVCGDVVFCLYELMVRVVHDACRVLLCGGDAMELSGNLFGGVCAS